MALREILASFGFKVDNAPLNAADKAISGLTSKIKDLGQYMAAGFIVNNAKDMLGVLVDQASALDDTSQQLGVNRQELQRWQLAAKLGGAEAADLATAIKITQKGIAEATANNAATGGPFKELGISLRETNGEIRPTLDVMADVGDAIASIQDPSTRTATALGIFGKAGTKLIPMMSQGREAFQAALGELDALGGGLSEGAIDALAATGDELDRLDVAVLSLKSSVAAQLVPSLNKFISGITKGISAFSKTKEGAQALKDGIRVLGMAGAAAGVAFIAPWLPTIGFFLGLGVLVDDLIGMFTGKRSIIGDALNSLFGPNAVEEITGTIKELFAVIKDAPNIGAAIEGAFLKVGEHLITFFEDTLPAAIKQALKDIRSAFDGGDRKLLGASDAQRLAEVREDLVAKSEGATPEEARARADLAGEKARLQKLTAEAEAKINMMLRSQGGVGTKASEAEAERVLPTVSSANFPALFADIAKQTNLSTDVLDKIAAFQRVQQVQNAGAAFASDTSSLKSLTGGYNLATVVSQAPVQQEVLKEVLAQQQNTLSIINNYTIDGSGDPDAVVDGMNATQAEAIRGALAGVRKVKTE